MIRIGKVSSFLFIATVLFSLNLFAKVSVVSAVDRNELYEGETLILTVMVSSENTVNIAEPRLPDMSSFDVLNKWESSEIQSSFQNGQFETVRRQNFNYQLVPKRSGQVEIGSVEVVVDGEVYNTTAIQIKVLPAQQGSRPSRPQPQQNAPDPFEDMEEANDLFNQLLQRRGMGQPGLNFPSGPVNPDEAFFIQLNTDKKSVYEGEQVTASWYLYTRGQIQDIDTLKYPSVNGFWKEDIEVATRLDFEQEIINGIPYRRALLASYALFPIKQGNAVIDSYKAKCTVLVPLSGLGGFGIGKPYVFTKASREQKIQVLPLPIEGRPASFSGAVGEFEIQASIERNEVPSNQPISMKIRVEGRGNAKLIELPKLNLPPSIELYDTRKDSKFFKDGRSYREFELILIPRQEGEILIPSIPFGMFSPATKRYVEKSTPALTIKVLPGQIAGRSQQNSDSLSDKNSTPETRLVAPNYLREFRSFSLLSDSDRFALAFIVTLLYLTLIAFKVYLEFGRDRGKKNLLIEMRKRMRKVSAALDKGDWRTVGIEATNTIYHILGEVSGQGGAHQEIEKLLRAAPPSVRHVLGEDIYLIMDQLQKLGFAPDEVVGELKNKQQLKRLVGQVQGILEKAIKNAADSQDRHAT